MGVAIGVKLEARQIAIVRSHVVDPEARIGRGLVNRQAAGRNRCAGIVVRERPGGRTINGVVNSVPHSVGSSRASKSKMDIRPHHMCFSLVDNSISNREADERSVSAKSGYASCGSGRLQNQRQCSSGTLAKKQI